MRYRSKPSEVEAVQWTGNNDFELGIDLGKRICRDPDNSEQMLLLAGKDGAQGWVPVPVGHWIVRRPADLSHWWPVDPDYFAEKYELVQ